MGKRNRRVSFSQYKLFKKCELAYKFQYVDKIGEWRENIHLVFGTAMHDTVQCLLYLLYNMDVFKESDNPDDKVNGITVNDYVIRKDGKLKDFDTSRLLKERMYHEVDKIDKDVRSERVSKEELIEFYQDGVFILDYLKSKRSDWFTLKGWELLGIEYPLKKELKDGLEFVGYIDILLMDDKENIHIIDLKTSTEAWGYYKKKDTVTTNQNLLYKSYLSDKLDVPLNKINVEYLVLKRKVNDNFKDFPEGRLQRFVPSNGIISVKSAVDDFEMFVDSVFDENGKRSKTREYKPNPTKFNCTYCDFREMGVCDYVHEDAKKP